MSDIEAIIAQLKSHQGDHSGAHPLQFFLGPRAYAYIKRQATPEQFERLTALGLKLQKPIVRSPAP